LLQPQLISNSNVIVNEPLHFRIENDCMDANVRNETASPHFATTVNGENTTHILLITLLITLRGHLVFTVTHLNSVLKLKRFDSNQVAIIKNK
jgi:hypothetical protein